MTAGGLRAGRGGCRTASGWARFDLPDERKRPSVNGRPTRPPVKAASLVAATPRPPHDPTHPGPAPRPPGRPELTSAQELPSGASTARLKTGSTQSTGQETEAKTNRLSLPGNAPPELRSPGGSVPPVPARPSPPPTPSSGQTRAMPVSTPVPTNNSGHASDPADPTAALPVMRPEGDDSEAATEKLNAPRRRQAITATKRVQRRRGGGGLSAQDLLRREGRL